MEKMMTLLEDLPWDVGPYPGSRMKIYPMIEGTPFFCGVIDLEPGAVLEEHEEPFNELSFVIKGDAMIEGRSVRKAPISTRRRATNTGPSRPERAVSFLS